MNTRTVSFHDLSDFTRGLMTRFRENDVVQLSGELGSGKTTFLFYLVRQMGLKEGEHFSSPTFTILNRYCTRAFHVHHVDLYRLNRFEELEALDIIRLFDEPRAVTFIEWGDKFDALTGLYTKKILFEHVPAFPLERKITLKGFE